MATKTWILLRGLGQEAGHWGPFVEDFSRAVAPESVLALDLPGSGHHFTRVSPTTINGLFRFVRAEAKRLAKPNSKINLVALSLGGMVAMEWLRQNPEDLGRVILMNSSDAALSPVRDRLRWQIWTRFLRLLAQPNVREREKNLAELVINDEAARTLAIPVWTKVASEHPMGARSFLNQLWAAARFRAVEGSTSVPVLVLSGLGDRLVDPSCSSRLAERHGWPHARHPWAGHDLSWDDPEWVKAQILPGPT